MEAPAELKAAFESLALDDLAIRLLMERCFQYQRALAVKARETWAEARQVMNLPEGVEYNYKDGMVTPAIKPES